MRKKISKLTVISSIVLSVPMMTMLVAESTPKRTTGVRTNLTSGNRNKSGSVASLLSVGSTSSLTGGSKQLQTKRVVMGTSGLQTKSSSDEPRGHKPVRTKTYKMAIGNSNGMYGSREDILKEESLSSKQQGIVNHGAGSSKDLTTLNKSSKGASGGTSVVPSKSGGSSSGKGSLWNNLKRFFKK